MADENKKGKNKGEEATLEMTPMIDVVFQLLIFFIVTLNQPDILSQFDALRPSDDKSTEVKDPPVAITIKGFPSRPGLGAYFFGNDVFVAPVIERKAKTRTVFLPEGQWVSFADGRDYDGGQEITFAARLGVPTAFYRKESAFKEIFSEAAKLLP